MFLHLLYAFRTISRDLGDLSFVYPESGSQDLLSCLPRHLQRIVLLDIEFLVDFFFPPTTWNMSFCSILASVVSDKKTIVFIYLFILFIEDHLYTTNCYSLAAFKIFSLTLDFGSLTIIHLNVGLSLSYL